MKLFSRVVLEKLINEHENALREIEKAQNEAMDKKQAEIFGQGEGYKKNMARRAEEERKKILALAKAEARNRILLKKESLFKEFLEALKDRLGDFSRGPDYGDWLRTRCLSHGDFAKEGGKSLRILCLDRDRDAIRKHLDAPGAVFEFPEHFIGGFILIDEAGGIRIDESLESLLEESKPMIGAMIGDYLAKAGEES